MSVPVINGTAVSVNGQGSGTTIALVGFSTSGAGKVIVTTAANGLTVSSISGAGLTWTARGAVSSPNLETWEADSSGAISSQTITITYSGTINFATATVFGVGTVVDFDVNGSLPHQSATDPGTVSTTAAETMIFASCRYSGTETPTAAADWTVIHSGGFMGVFYRTYTSAQTSLSVPAGGSGAGGANGQISDALEGSATLLTGSGFLFII